MLDTTLFQSEPDNTPVMIAILRERTEVLGREMRELKEAQRAQMIEMRVAQEKLSDKLDDVLAVMSEARGGWRTLMLMGGAAGSLGAGITWVINHWKP